MMTSLLIRIFYFILIIQLSIKAQALDKTQVEIFSDHQQVTPGQKLRIGIYFKHPDGWHSYHRNSGGIEQSFSWMWHMDDHVVISEPKWPTPKVKDSYFGKSFIYENPTFLFDIQVPEKLKTGDTFHLKGTVDWQICKLSCISESQEIELRLPVNQTPIPNPQAVSRFTLLEEALPKPLAIKPPQVTKTNGSVQMVFENLPASPVEWIADQPFVDALSASGQVEQIKEKTIVRLKIKEKNILDEPIVFGESISGILFLGSMENAYFLSPQIIEKETITTTAPLLNQNDLPSKAFLSVLIGMFIGGLILNLMPCVFPVIGLKIMSFVEQSGASKKKIWMHGVSFTAGVIISFAALSGTLYGLRLAALKAGKSADVFAWGYQLQNPWVVMVLLLLMFILALNLIGTFEIGISATSLGGTIQQKKGILGSFFSGVLATIVATPCSAPFLGVAIGTAVTLPAVSFFTAFAAMALGLSFPYLILSLFPSFTQWLPRPGAWMETFKQVMAFPLFATSAYLLWVYTGLLHLEHALNSFLALALIALGFWIYGRWFRPYHGKIIRWMAVFLLLLTLSCGIWMMLPAAKSNEWQTWSNALEKKLLQEGKPVFIDFTAQWCVTCQVNKKRAYTEDNLALFKTYEIALLRADKTAPNAEIEKRMTELGRSAVPLNVLILPNQAPIFLSELFSQEDLKETILRAFPD